MIFKKRKKKKKETLGIIDEPILDAYDFSIRETVAKENGYDTYEDMYEHMHGKKLKDIF